MEKHSKHLFNHNNYTPSNHNNSQQPQQQSRVYKCHKKYTYDLCLAYSLKRHWVKG